MQDLFVQQGQSPWLDNLKRDYITSGKLVEVRDSGVRGLTSNPSIFQKAIQGSADYDEQFNEIAADGGSIVDDYWSLVIRDIHGACDVFLEGLRPVERQPMATSVSKWHRASPTMARARRLLPGSCTNESSAAT